MLNEEKQTRMDQDTAGDLSAKKHLYLTGTLLSPVRPGRHAIYLYHGNMIKTSKVIAILEASKDYICFETQNSIYTLGHIQIPSECFRQCA